MKAQYEPYIRFGQLRIELDAYGQLYRPDGQQL